MSETRTSKNRLLAMYIAREAIPKGGDYKNGIEFLTNPDVRRAGVEAANQKMLEAISAVRSCSGYEKMSDEDIAKILVEKIDARRS